MAVALVQEFKIVGSDRSTANYDHIAQRLDFDSNPPEGLIYADCRLGRTGPVDPERGEPPDLESMYELHHCVRGR